MRLGLRIKRYYSSMENIGEKIKGRFDITKVYEKYRTCLKNAKEGEVVTRFPPEPSGFLHVGHIKALFLNYHYSKIFNGKMLLRFDDTNPAKEKQEYVDSIIADMKTLDVLPDAISYTSDHFDLIAEHCRSMLEKGQAYCDATDVENMRKERFDGIESKYRNTTPEENLKIWADMLKGEEYSRKYCVRAKISVDAKNKCLRDPTIYRFKDDHHARTGTKWRVYPTYDFACPIVDAVEGVTHALRTNEYADRIAQYEWVQKTLGLRKVNIYEFSRLCFVSTMISKRNLTFFVNAGIVDGWNDPRFPTVQGLLRRGMVLPTLIEFMLDQGPSKNNNLMEWDKIWAINKTHLENVAGKFTAVSTEKTCPLTVTNYTGPVEVESIPIHPKNLDLGERLVFKGPKLYLEFDDAENIKEGEKITLMKWGNFKITSKKTCPDTGIHTFEAEYLPEDKDFKTTQKITWLIGDESQLTVANLNEYDHLITVQRIEEDMKAEDHVNPNSKMVTKAFADPSVKELPIGAFVQFERRGNYRIDAKHIDKDGKLSIDFVFVPDGKSKGMSNIKSKVDAKEMAKGKGAKEETPAPQEPKKEAGTEVKEPKEGVKVKEVLSEEEKERRKKEAMVAKEAKLKLQKEEQAKLPAN